VAPYDDPRTAKGDAEIEGGAQKATAERGDYDANVTVEALSSTLANNSVEGGGEV